MFPLLSEYIESIKSAEDNFMELSYLRPVLGDDGEPIMTSGNFAVVFKMKDKTSGKFYAVKCFTKEQEGREEAYHQIAEELKDVDSPYLVSLRYLDKELFVDTDQTDETEFPILLMDWVEGKTLDKYLRENLDDKYALEMLAYRFSQLAQWIIPQPFAHGDLKPDNIIVREDGTLVLVDYDGMYVPAMKGQKARELGSPDFRHPLRTENDFDEHIDDFPLVSILLSLNSISTEPQLLEEFGAQDRLLLSEDDYRIIISSGLISKCTCVKKLPDYYPVIKRLTRYLWDLLLPNEMNESCLDLSVEVPVPMKNRTTTMTSQEKMDSKFYKSYEYEVKYCKDDTKLLSFLDGVVYDDPYLGETHLDGCQHYQIKKQTITICDNAFKYCRHLRFLTIPDSVKYIGHRAFFGCHFNYIELPFVDGIYDDTFENCPYLKHIFIPMGTYSHFEKLLPNEKHKLKEINKDFVYGKIASYLQKSNNIPIYTAAESLYKSICFIHNVCNVTHLSIDIFRHEGNEGCIWINREEDYYYINIADVTNITDMTKVTYLLLLDTGMIGLTKEKY